jgi:hypothetical protein
MYKKSALYTPGNAGKSDIVKLTVTDRSRSSFGPVRSLQRASGGNLEIPACDSR